MKSLILKDLYSISHNMKSMAFILLFLAAVQVYSMNDNAFVVTCTILCSMMTITTFTFDERSKWNRYGIIMPVTRADMVKAKFFVNFIFIIIGVITGIVLNAVGSIFFGKWTQGIDDMITLYLTAMTAVSMSLVYGGTLIPLAIRFGSEKSRIYIAGVLVVLVGITMLIAKVLSSFGFEITGNAVFGLITISPVLAILWNIGMYQIGRSLFEKQEI